ncbi:MAG: E3 binding domain-containing protein, partial [Polaribacter sp.]
MATVVNMPRLSDTMEEGVVAQWLKKVGDKIEEGDILAEIETDKATMEFESFHEGVLLHIGVQEGETSPVDKLLAIIGEEDEDISGLLSGGNSSEEKEEEKTVTSEEIKEDTSSDNSSSEATVIPDGVQVITMPRLSDTMTDGTVASWLKKEGDSVEEGDILAEIETDKATMEFECFYEGTILYIGVQEGETAPVDSLLTIIGPAGTNVSAIIAGGVATAVTSSVANSTETEIEKKEDKVEATKAPAVHATINNSGGRIFASPLAKKIAVDKGINLANVAGSGENGRIIKKDVENYIPAAKPVEAAVSSVAPVVSFTTEGEEKSEEIKNSQMRKAIAKSLGSSKFSAPDFSLNIEVQMDNAMASRKTINSIPDTKVSFNDMVVKACAMALQKHP